MNKQLSLQGSHVATTTRVPALMDIVCLLLPVGAFLLWYFSVGSVNIFTMNDLGLVSVMPPTMIIALMIMVVSFCLTLHQPQPRTWLLILHIALLIFMLYGITTLVEQAPRFNIVYRHTGYTEYIMRTGTVNPYLDAYFNWPGFFILTAFITRISGYHDLLAYADWAPVLYNILYFGPLYLLFSTFTLNKRLVWLCVCIFYISNWIGQDYLSPQGYFFSNYILIMALFLRWFKTAPGTPLRPLGPRLSRNRYLSLFHSWLIAPDPVYKSIPKRKRLALLIIILVLYAFMVYSHQLTPFFVLMSLIPLIFLQRISYKIWWMPCIMMAMLLGWILIMTQPYLAGHTSDVLGGLGNIFSSFGQNVASRVGGDPQHTFIARMRLIMPVSLWGLAFVGAISRLSRGHRDATVIVMALAPFPLFIAQPYGGEMLLRCYLFSQPSMIFLGASLFYESPSFAAIKPLRWLEGMKTNVTRLRGFRVTAIACLLLIFLGMFFFTRYGNELMDYKTYDEVNGVLYLYNVAPNKSLFVAGWNGSPWQLEDFEKFDLVALSDTTKLSEDVGRLDLQAVIQFMQAQHRPRSYIFFTRSQIATFNGTSGFPPGGLTKFEQAVQASGDFNLIYSNKDVEVFQLDSSIAAGGK